MKDLPNCHSQLKFCDSHKFVSNSDIISFYIRFYSYCVDYKFNNELYETLWICGSELRIALYPEHNFMPKMVKFSTKSRSYRLGVIFLVIFTPRAIWDKIWYLKAELLIKFCPLSHKH